MVDLITSSLLFHVTILLIPLLALSYLGVVTSQKLWLFIISILHPEVEFLRTTTVRTVLDTHRNQGIVSVLLCIKGHAQPEAVRRHLQEVVKRRDKTGKLTFPRLRHCLVAKLGTYAWEKGKFDLDQNVTMAPLSYKGRSVTEYNIQDYVCEIVSKYLPQGIPPWQVIIIPTSEDQHYILIKLHHVLLSEGLNIGDLMPLIPPTRQGPSSAMVKSPLVEVLHKPKAIPLLKQKVGDELTNLWNDIISKYDPLERIDLLKTTPSFFQFQAILFVSLVSTIKEFRKGFRFIKEDVATRCKYFVVTLKKECKRRRVTFPMLIKSMLVTIDPRNTVKAAVANIIQLLKLPLVISLCIAKEVNAVISCIVNSYCYGGTLVSWIYNYVPLLYSCCKEIFFYIVIVFEAPRTLIQDILLQKESFQTITLCGRKSVAWSEPVKAEFVKAIAKCARVSETEICLATISACISKYLIQTKHLIPDYLPISLRNINSQYIFGTGPNVKPEDSVSGILCLNLPILDPEKETSILENLVEVKTNFRNSLDKQGLSHLLSLCQTKFGFLTKILPLSLLSVYLRHLSRKYAVSVTEVTNRYPNVTQKTLWGHEVTSVIYWRPPQANSSVSLCLNEYADHIRLGVMCDSQLVPYHSILAKAFPDYLNEIAAEISLKQ